MPMQICQTQIKSDQMQIIEKTHKHKIKIEMLLIDLEQIVYSNDKKS